MQEYDPNCDTKTLTTLTACRLCTRCGAGAIWHYDISEIQMRVLSIATAVNLEFRVTWLQDTPGYSSLTPMELLSVHR